MTRLSTNAANLKYFKYYYSLKWRTNPQPPSLHSGTNQWSLWHSPRCIFVFFPSPTHYYQATVWLVFILGWTWKGSLRFFTNNRINDYKHIANLVLRHSILHFPPHFRDIACWELRVELNAAPSCYQSEVILILLHLCSMCSKDENYTLCITIYNYII